jgi:hypothetical protein
MKRAVKTHYGPRGLVPFWLALCRKCGTVGMVRCIDQLEWIAQMSRAYLDAQGGPGEKRARWKLRVALRGGGKPTREDRGVSWEDSVTRKEP